MVISAENCAQNFWFQTQESLKSINIFITRLTESAKRIHFILDMIVYDIIIVLKINIFKKNKNSQKLEVGMIFGNAAGIFSKFGGSFLMISLKFFFIFPNFFNSQ